MNNAEIKEKAKEALKNAVSESDAIEALKEIGLPSAVVMFSKPNGAGQVMKIGMAHYGEEIIHF
jgi:hypothetical protein